MRVYLVVDGETVELSEDPVYELEQEVELRVGDKVHLIKIIGIKNILVKEGKYCDPMVQYYAAKF